jgi:hypothetical protein
VEFNGTVTIRFLNATEAFSDINPDQAACIDAFTRAVELQSQTSDVLSTTVSAYNIRTVSRLNTIESDVTFTIVIVALDAAQDDKDIFENEFNNRISSGQFDDSLELRARNFGCDAIDTPFASDTSFPESFKTTFVQTAPPTVATTSSPTPKGENESLDFSTETIIIIVIVFFLLVVLACYLQRYIKRRRKKIRKLTEAESLGRDPINLEQQHIEGINKQSSLNEMLKKSRLSSSFDDETRYSYGVDSPRILRKSMSTDPTSPRTRNTSSSGKYGINRSKSSGTPRSNYGSRSPSRSGGGSVSYAGAGNPAMFRSTDTNDMVYEVGRRSFSENRRSSGAEVGYEMSPQRGYMNYGQYSPTRQLEEDPDDPERGGVMSAGAAASGMPSNLMVNPEDKSPIARMSGKCLKFDVNLLSTCGVIILTLP